MIFNPKLSPGAQGELGRPKDVLLKDALSRSNQFTVTLERKDRLILLRQDKENWQLIVPGSFFFTTLWILVTITGKKDRK